MTDSNKNTITLATTMGYSIVDFSQDNDNYLLLTLKGTKIEYQNRLPISVIALLDISSSMAPDYKIGYLKKSMTVLIDNLNKNDKLAIVAYSSICRTILPLTIMDDGNKKKATKAVSDLITGGTTNISGALSVGYDEFRSSDIADGINRIILFTDGCPTTGNTNNEALVALAGKCPQGTKVTTMGYGKPTEASPGQSFWGMEGELNIQLLQAMANSGKGNYYYMSDPDSCGRAFASELGGLLTVVGQDIKITIDPKKMEIVEVMDDVDVVDKEGKAIITIPDILAEEARYILVKVKTKKQDKKWAREGNIADVTVEYTNTIEGRTDTLTGNAKITFTNKGFDPIHPEVQTQIAIIEAIEAQKKADDLATKGKFDDAIHIMNLSADNLLNTGTCRGVDIGTSFGNLSKKYIDINEFTCSANVRSSSSHSLKKGRVSGGVFDTVYATAAQKDMQSKFVDDNNKNDGTGDANTHGNCSSINEKTTPIAPDIVNSLPQSDPIIMDTDEPKKKEKSFSKKTRRDSW